MRLCSLWLREFGVLRKFAVSFAPAESSGAADNLHFLVGLNGSGKSSVLRAVARIFDQLGQRGDVDFPFEITYKLAAGPQVTISKRSANRPPVVRFGDDRQGSPFSISVLPERVIAFTTGREEGWLRPVAEPDRPLSEREHGLLAGGDRFLKELPRRSLPAVHEETESGSRVHLISSTRIPLVFLCGYLADQAAPVRRLDALLADARIKSLTGFSLRIRSDWSNLHPADTATACRLWEAASHRVQEGAEVLLVFDLESPAPRALNLLQYYPGGLALFLALDRLSGPSAALEGTLLRDVNLFVRRVSAESTETESSQVPPLHLFDWLSDGEKDFLGRMALFAMLGGIEALLLIDEPEVHFNDYWKRQIVHLISQSLRQTASHALVATHSSITLSDVRQQHIRLLRRGSLHTGEAEMPPIQTFAADPGDILVYVFGAPFRTGRHVEEEIARVINDPALTPELRAERLRDLADEFAPGYWSYRMRDYLKRPEVHDASSDDTASDR